MKQDSCFHPIQWLLGNMQKHPLYFSSNFMLYNNLEYLWIRTLRENNWRWVELNPWPRSHEATLPTHLLRPTPKWYSYCVLPRVMALSWSHWYCEIWLRCTFSTFLCPIINKIIFMTKILRQIFVKPSFCHCVKFSFLYIYLNLTSEKP